jgi:hypothetical protein
MSTSTTQESRPSVTPLVLWLGRVVGAGFALLGVVTLFTVAEVEADQVATQVLIGLLGLVGGLLFIIGLQGAHRLSTAARLIGWLMMLGFAVFPGMVWFVWGPLALLALPAVLMSRRAS